MKLKNRDLTAMERRLGSVDAQFSKQDKIIRAASLGVVIFAAAALAGVVIYLVYL